MYYVEDHTNEIPEKNRTTQEFTHSWEAFELARRWLSEGLEVHVLYQSLDHMPMHYISISEWK